MATAKPAPKPRKKAVPEAESAPSKPKIPKAKAKPAIAEAPPEPKGPPESAAGAKPAQPPFTPFETVLSADQLKMVETLSANLARAAVTAQGAIAEAALRQADRPAALTPFKFSPPRSFDQVQSSFSNLAWSHLACRPLALAHYTVHIRTSATTTPR